MSTSGVTINPMTKAQIIKGALRKVGAIQEGQDPTPQQLADASEALGPLVQELVTVGMPLWKRRHLDLPLVAGKNTYTIGVGQEVDVPYPLKLHQVNLHVGSSGSQINVDIKADYDFSLLPIYAEGTVVSVKYQPFINYGVLTVWPKPLTPDQTMVLVYQEPYDTFAAETDEADFPQEWQNALIYQLALILADDYSLPIADKQWLEKQADKRLASALAFGTEEVSIFFHPNPRSM